MATTKAARTAVKNDINTLKDDLKVLGTEEKARLREKATAAEARLRAKAAQAGDRVPGRPPARLDASRGQGIVEIVTALSRDQVRPRLGDFVLHQEVVIHLCNHVHDGVAKGDDVILHRHENSSPGRGKIHDGKPGSPDFKTVLKPHASETTGSMPA
jgi:hypothetical protein